MADGKASSLQEALGEVVDGGLARGMGATQRASRAWWQANGDFEHRHTCGVFLKDLSELDRAPELYVYIDSSAVLQDFATNREIYLTRLENAGFVVSDVRFRLSKFPRRGSGPPASDASPAAHALRAVAAPLPPATEEERDRARRACEDLPDGLRDRVAAAMLSSMVRQRCKDTEK